MSSQQENYYGEHYQNVHYKGSLGLFTSMYHTQLERRRKPTQHHSNVLEIGAGIGEHLRFVRHTFDAYVLSDITAHPNSLSNLDLDPRRGKLTFLVADATNLPIENNRFDRVLSTCVLHHISNLELALSEIRRVSANDAVIDLYVPCDPGLLYRWLRHVTSHYKQKKSMKLSWSEVKYLWAKEHPNHYLGIISLIKFIFRGDDLKISRYPLLPFSWNFNLFAVVSIKVVKSNSIKN